jgi:hypothetical protein
MTRGGLEEAVAGRKGLLALSRSPFSMMASKKPGARYGRDHR